MTNMSDRQLRPTTNGSVSKRPRKPTLRNNDNEEKQRERKRALDRKAQRASREKTRSHIAHLEKMVKVLSEKNGSTATTELMDEVTRLQAEVDRLRKIIDSIKSVLGTDIVEASTTRQPSQCHENGSSSSHSPRLNEQNLCEINSPSDDSPKAHMVGDIRWEANAEDEDLDAPADTQVCSGPYGKPPKSESNNRRINLDWMDSIDEGSVALTSRWDGMRDSTYQQQQFWDLPSPVNTALPNPPVPEYTPCTMWKKANSIYARIFGFDPQKVYGADKADSGSLVKVVKCGWEALNVQERSNPVLQILKEVDQNLFWDLDPVTKFANLYKSLLILKYYFNPSKHNLEKMPQWQRPVHSQKTRRHPIPIDFFPWPALRDRFVRHHNYYFSTNEFSTHYREHFKFRWPFGFEETYRFDPMTKTYKISPLFEQYHRDTKCWTLEKVFFQKFPEFVNEISVYEDCENDSPPPLPLPNELYPNPAFDFVPGFSSIQDTPAKSIRQPNYSFTENCMMELFNDFPPT